MIAKLIKLNSNGPRTEDGYRRQAVRSDTVFNASCNLEADSKIHLSIGSTSLDFRHQCARRWGH